MTVLMEYLGSRGHILEALADPTLLALSPGGDRRRTELDPDVATLAVWTDSSLVRNGFAPTIVVSAARISPGVDPVTVLDRLDDTASTLPNWHRRAGARSTDADGRHTSDTMGQYSLGSLPLMASTIATVWRDGGSTILKQIVVTTFPDQIEAHRTALEL